MVLHTDFLVRCTVVNLYEYIKCFCTILKTLHSIEKLLRGGGQIEHVSNLHYHRLALNTTGQHSTLWSLHMSTAIL